MISVMTPKLVLVSQVVSIMTLPKNTSWNYLLVMTVLGNFQKTTVGDYSLLFRQVGGFQKRTFGKIPTLAPNSPI